MSKILITLKGARGIGKTIIANNIKKFLAGHDIRTSNIYAEKDEEAFMVDDLTNSQLQLLNKLLQL